MEIKIRETINLPKVSIERILEAMRLFESAQDDIEDFLIFKNKEILKKVKNADKERKKSMIKNFHSLAGKYV